MGRGRDTSKSAVRKEKAGYVLSYKDLGVAVKCTRRQRKLESSSVHRGLTRPAEGSSDRQQHSSAHGALEKACCGERTGGWEGGVEGPARLEAATSGGSRSKPGKKLWLSLGCYPFGL